MSKGEKGARVRNVPLVIDWKVNPSVAGPGAMVCSIRAIASTPTRIARVAVANLAGSFAIAGGPETLCRSML